ncbi:hypothetical protein ADL34_27415 [Streptomyces sp. NRRL WC-3605]|nr:hypothetical protein ADL33_28815 [Streptomyces sp. NRRL WC-3604]KUL70549.1 hypothetical protein ADL34_27415 [Streptomyces sp. NRRL WC-3605]
MRSVAVAASLAGVLALTACGGGGDSDGDSTPSGAPTSADAGTGGGTGEGSGGGSASSAGDLEGSWLATTDGKAVALVVTGDKAGLFATGGSVCSGTAGEQGGKRTIRLKCTDGSKDRAAGTVDSVGGGELKVTWEGGLGVETYTKAEGGKLPTGLPTAGLGS